MNALIEFLNRWGETAIPLAGQVLWQSSLLIIVLLALDLLLRHRIHAGFRYALWMLLLVKLVLPPSLALPTGAGYWIERPERTSAVVPVAVSIAPPSYEFDFGAMTTEPIAFEPVVAELPSTLAPQAPPPLPAPRLTRDGKLVAGWLGGMMFLLAWMLWRWRWVTRLVRASEPAPAELHALLANVCRDNVSRAACPTSNVSPAACRQSVKDRRSARSGEANEGANVRETSEAFVNAEPSNGALGETRPTLANVLPALGADYRHSDAHLGHERKGDISVAQSRVEATGMSPFRFLGRQHACPTLRLTDTAMSPAVCGLFRPVILLPRKLVNRLTDEQLRTVLLHELIHLRRRDLWVNCLQTLLQIAAWWHPLLWVANARIRRVREEAVDEAVACALRDDADAYPATLLEVAKLTFTRPLLTLGLVGILESKNALKQRIRRLLELPPLESTRLKWWQWVAVAALALTALPMAEGQQATDQANDGSVDVPANAEPKPTVPLQLETREFRVNPNSFYQSLERISASLPPYTNSSGAVLTGSQAFQSATEAGGVTLVHHFIRTYFEKFGVKLDPPKAVFFNDRKGILLVRATIEDLEIIQRAIEALNTEPGQIALEVRTVEVRAEDVAALGKEVPRLMPLTEANKDYVAPLSDTELNSATNLVGRRGLEFKPLIRVTTLSSHNTELKLRDTPLIVAPKFGPQFDKLEVNPYALVDRENLQMTIIATIRTRTVDDQGKSSPHAYFLSQKVSSAAMKHGETIALAVSAGLDDAEKNDGNLQTLVFITPTIIDPAGNRLGPVASASSPFAAANPSAGRSWGVLVESAPKWPGWGMRRPSPPSVLDSTNLVELGRIMITDEARWPDPRVNGYRPIGLEPRFVLVTVESLTKALGGRLPLAKPMIIASNELAALTNSLIEAGAVDHSAAEPLKFSQMSGSVFHWQVARGEPSQVQIQVEDKATTNQVVFGARHGITAFVPDWVPLTLLARPFANGDESIHCLLSLSTGEFEPSKLVKAEETIPLGGSLIWASTNEVRVGFAQVVVLKNIGEPESHDSQAGAPGTKPAATAPVAQTLEMVKALIVIGRLDEAERIVRDAARVDPDNSEIAYYLDRIQQLRSERSQSAPGSTSTSPGRHTMMEKLYKITLDQLHFEGLPLSEVIKELSDEVRRSDPDKTGVSFILVPRIESPDAAEGSAPTNDLANAVIDINPPLKHLRLIDALHAIVTASDRRIKFTVEEFAVVFTQGTSEPVKLETRQFQVNPRSFYDGLRKIRPNLPPPTSVLVSAGSGEGVRFLTTTNDMSLINAAVLQYFKAMGVTLTPPKTLFFNDRKGLLLVRATAEDFQFIERAIETLNPDPPQVLLEVQAFEITDDDVRASGFDWFVGGTVINGDTATNSGSTSSPVGTSSPVNPSENIPTPLPPEAGTDNLLTSRPREEAGAAPLATITGILTVPQFRAVRQAMSQRLGVEIGIQHRLVTLSGRQTQVVLTNRLVNGPQRMNLMRPEAMNPILDLIPYVGPDGFTIQMTVIPTLVEFVSSIKPGPLLDSPIQTPDSGILEKTLTVSRPLPRYRMRQVASSVNVWDGQTIVQSYPLRVEVPPPHLAGAPPAGPDETGKRHLLIFITPTIVDAAGNPVHKPGELPHANELVPPPPTEPQR